MEIEAAYRLETAQNMDKLGRLTPETKACDWKKVDIIMSARQMNGHYIYI